MVLGFGWLKILLSVVWIFFFFHENINFVVQIPRNFNGFKKNCYRFHCFSLFFYIFFVNNVYKIINLIIVTLMLRNQGCGLIEHEFFVVFSPLNILNDEVYEIWKENY